MPCDSETAIRKLFRAIQEITIQKLCRAIQKLYD